MTLMSERPAADFDWPMFGLIDDVRPAMAEARAEKRPLALATLFAVEGGAPRGLGAQMVFGADGPVAGFLSGGCIEADVALYAQRVLETGAPVELVYGDGGPADIALPCGSRIEILVERLAPDDAAVGVLLRSSDRRTPVEWFSDGVRRVCQAEGGSAPLFNARVRKTYSPPLRALVVGGDPAALAAARLMAESGIATTLNRPKGPETPPPFPLNAYRREAADQVIDSLDPDRWTAICIMTHDLEVEQTATAAALRTRAGYVGVLGSRRRAPERETRLRTIGFDNEAIARLHAPIGLPIGGKAPWDIAISVVAEVVLRLSEASEATKR